MLFVAMLTLCNIVPHGQSPDEMAHMSRASSLAHGHFILKSKDGIVGDEIDEGLFEYYSETGKLAFHYDKKADNFGKLKEIRFTGKRKVASFANTAVYFPLTYTPQAIAIFIGEKTHMRVSSVINLARVLCFITVVVSVAISIRLYKPSLLSSLVLLMPMSLFQMVSSTSDGVHFAMIFLIMSLFMNLHKQFNKYKLYILLSLIFIISTHRFNLLVLYILPMYLGWRNKDHFVIISSAVVALLSTGWILYTSISMPALRVSASTGEIIKYYLVHPLVTIKAFVHTATDWGLLKFYRNSFVGQLGWLDYSVSRWFIYVTHAILLILLAYFIKTNTSWRNEISLVLIVTSVLSVLAIFVLELVGWSDFPCLGSIQGVQGRYLIPSFIIIGFAVEIIKNRLEVTSSSCLYSVLVVLYGLCSILVTQVATLNRYWLN